LVISWMGLLAARGVLKAHTLGYYGQTDKALSNWDSICNLIL